MLKILGWVSRLSVTEDQFEEFSEHPAVAVFCWSMMFVFLIWFMTEIAP